MKKTGLKNRFSQAVRNVWQYWYDCMICGKNSIDVLHHILSPSSRFYIAGKHNESVLNSCPIHNQVCHIGNEAHLYSDDTIKLLLKKTYMALVHLEYEFNDLDREFLKVYADLYDNDIINVG